ncbi:Reverse transcriptase (RNA-dependent DNA polymerase) [Litoreibacter ascidiaceicola]|uniref:RNA-directed DNA polymerase n=1 Tax=Litoreibacter ascidiaceicola TaxID=1486859 RepID=A0A1M5EU25_9RHOB|nr:retron St85 family RNA-directed DNA polymerase [Litoreibacter ascidiaceicola]SHF82626.1 Reverse transcriptase (RNA-dependent DNA polymerase) [Litoreibacter ascidiaceicola]
MDAAALCLDLETLSGFLGFAPQHIYYLVESPESYYTTISIPKKSDPMKVRQIDIPFSELKGVQRAINKKILSELPMSDNVHSYVQGRSILTATKLLCPGRAILKVDIADFFPTITYRRVFGLFRRLGYNDAAAFILSRLCTKDDKLSQGAPTSPAISNAIMAGLDKRMERLAETWELKYLRYSDDMFFHKERNFNHTRLADVASSVVESSGFIINSSKTKYHPKGLPRITLGLLTHGPEPRIPGPQRKKYRAAFFRASRNINWAYERQAQLKGMLEWYKCVQGRSDEYIQYQAIFENIERLKIHDSYRSR